MSLEKICGIGTKISLGDKEYILSPLTIRDLGEIDAYVKAQRLKIFESANPKLSIKEKIEIKNITPTPEEVESEMGGIQGLCFQLWMGLRENYPEMTLMKINDLLIDVQTVKKVQDAMILT